MSVDLSVVEETIDLIMSSCNFRYGWTDGQTDISIDFHEYRLNEGKKALG